MGKIWTPGDIVTATDMNNIQRQIEKVTNILAKAIHKQTLDTNFVHLDPGEEYSDKRLKITQNQNTLQGTLQDYSGWTILDYNISSSENQYVYIAGYHYKNEYPMWVFTNNAINSNECTIISYRTAQIEKDRIEYPSLEQVKIPEGATHLYVCIGTKSSDSSRGAYSNTTNDYIIKQLTIQISGPYYVDGPAFMIDTTSTSPKTILEAGTYILRNIYGNQQDTVVLATEVELPIIANRVISIIWNEQNQNKIGVKTSEQTTAVYPLGYFSITGPSAIKGHVYFEYDFPTQ